MTDFTDCIYRAYDEGGFKHLFSAGSKKILQGAIQTMGDSVLKKIGYDLPFYLLINRMKNELYILGLEKKGIGRRLKISDLDNDKSSDTVFILGSGASINDINEDQWEKIGRHDSIGLNRWPIHDFIPTFLVFELPINESFRKDFVSLLDAKHHEYEDVRIIAKDIRKTRQYYKDLLPEWLENQLYLSNDSGFFELSFTRKEQERLLSYLYEQGYFESDQSMRIFYRKRGSISYLLHLSKILGYDKIILCGVDMVDSKYFFEERKSYYQNKEFPIPQRENLDEQQVHRTNDPKYADITLEQVIYLINNIILKEDGVELFVENTKSALHPTIPKVDYGSL